MTELGVPMTTVMYTVMYTWLLVPRTTRLTTHSQDESQFVLMIRR